jgi:Na+-translocating ferredoxin:NAD+ oxidoreductase RnfD subunit
MEEMEDPTERLQEKIHEEVTEKETMEKWSLYVVLSTALMAVLAAFTGWLGGHHANEALIAQMKASDQWAYYQAKGIKSEIITTESRLLTSITHRPAPDDDRMRTERYAREQESIKEAAEEFQRESEQHLHKHMILSRGVTIFQISIAIAAISILMKKRILWIISVAMAAVGIAFLVLGAMK